MVWWLGCQASQRYADAGCWDDGGDDDDDDDDDDGGGWDARRVSVMLMRDAGMRLQQTARHKLGARSWHWSGGQSPRSNLPSLSLLNFCQTVKIQSGGDLTCPNDVSSQSQVTRVKIQNEISPHRST